MNRTAEENNPVLQQARKNVVCALATAGLLDHHRNQQAHRMNHTIGAPALHPSWRPELAGQPETLTQKDLAHDVAVDDLARSAVEQNLARVNHVRAVDD